MLVVLCIVVYHATECLVGIGSSYNPRSFTVLLDVEALQLGGSITRKTSEIIGGLILAAIDRCIALEVERSVAHTIAITHGKLTASSFTRTIDDELSRESIPIAFDVFTQVMNIPNQRTLTCHFTFVGIPQVEIDGRGSAFNGLDGEIVGNATLILTNGDERTASHHQFFGLANTSIRDFLVVEFQHAASHHQITVELKEVRRINR